MSECVFGVFVIVFFYLMLVVESWWLIIIKSLWCYSGKMEKIKGNWKFVYVFFDLDMLCVYGDFKFCKNWDVYRR